jgi:thioredoxin reductase
MTLFCPTNEAFAEFADDLGLSGSGPKAVDQLLALAKANPETFKTVRAGIPRRRKPFN